MKRREERLAKIREAKARLEAEALAKAEEEQRRRDEEQAKREAEGRKRRGKEPAPIDPTPEDKAQTNFTDPEAKIMKQSNKGFDYSYNAQAVVDGEDQIIVAAEVTNAANDKQQAVPMAQAALNNLDAAGIERPKGADGTPTPIPNTADTGYFSEKAVEGLEKIGIDPHIAVGRQKHHETPVAPESAAASAEASAKEKMQQKLRLGDRQSSVRGTQAHRRAGIRPDQIRAGNPQVSVARTGEGVSRVATDLLDAQSSEDLAPLLQCRLVLRGTVRARVGLRPKRPKPSETKGQSASTGRILGHAPRARASALASVVFPRPGRSSTSRCPARQQTGQHVFDHVGLAPQGMVEGGPNSVDRAGIVCLDRAHCADNGPHAVAAFLGWLEDTPRKRVSVHVFTAWRHAFWKSLPPGTSDSCCPDGA